MTCTQCLFHLPVAEPCTCKRQQIDDESRHHRSSCLHTRIGSPRRLRNHTNQKPNCRRDTQPPKEENMIPPGSVTTLNFLPEIEIYLLYHFLYILQHRINLLQNRNLFLKFHLLFFSYPIPLELYFL